MMDEFLTWLKPLLNDPAVLIPILVTVIAGIYQIIKWLFRVCNWIYRTFRPKELEDLTEIDKSILFFLFPNNDLLWVRTQNLTFKFLVQKHLDSDKRMIIDLRTEPPSNISFNGKVMETNLSIEFLKSFDLLRNTLIHNESESEAPYKLTPQGRELVKKNFDSMRKSTIKFFREKFGVELDPYLPER